MAQLDGVYRGTVINTADPQGSGRVQVRMANLTMGGSSQWAAVCTTPGAPRNTGLSISDDVLVAFENGSPDHPVVLGVLQGR